MGHAVHSPRSWRLPGGLLLAMIVLLAAGGTIAMDRLWRAGPTVPPTASTEPFAEIPSHHWMSWTGVPEGTVAPDFVLPSLGGTNDVRLDTLRRDKPVVLILGSLTCDVMKVHLSHLEALYQRHRQETHFLFVYVREGGHPLPGLEFLIPPGYQRGFTGPRPRADRVQRGMHVVNVTIPTVIDGDDGQVMRSYAGFPLRLLIVDRQGRVAMDLGNGLRQHWNLDRVDAWLTDKGKRRDPSL